MTRAQFLNDLYRRLCGNGLDKDQAEQHLTYYAEMLADRMEEGMSEDEAVAGMEDVDTIVRRILEEEGLPYREVISPPEYPDVTKLGGGGGKRAYQVPRKWSWQKIAQAALWTLAVVAALGAVSRLMFGRGRNTSTSYDDTPVHADYASSIPVEEVAPFAWEYDEYYGLEAPYEYGYEYGGLPVSYVGNSVKKLDIEWAVGHVLVQSWSGDYIQIQEFSTSELTERNMMYVEDDGDDTLTVRYREGAGLGNVKGDKWLTVMLPDGMLSEMEIETTSADVWLEGLELAEIDVETVSGDVDLTSCYARTAEVETASGDVDVSGLYADELDVSTVSGDVYGDVCCGDIEASSASGRITLYANDFAEKVGLETVSGDIYLNAMGSGAVRAIHAETASGYVSIGLPYEAGFTLDFTSVSGSLNNTSFNMVGQDGKMIYNGGGCEIEVETISGDLEIY